jgi:hypothetical protein
MFETLLEYIGLSTLRQTLAKVTDSFLWSPKRRGACLERKSLDTHPIGKMFVSNILQQSVTQFCIYSNFPAKLPIFRANENVAMNQAILVDGLWQ